MTICSHTLVRNGMPFIIPVLRQVIPFMDRCLVTVSEKATDGTSEALECLRIDFPDKVIISTENVEYPGLLTGERQKQVDKTTEDWILFLDSDDWWPEESLKDLIELIKKEEDVDGYSFNPFQVVSEIYYDGSWWNKSFTKLFKNQPGVHYEGDWPRDVVMKDDKILYWKKNPRVPKSNIRFFHLANIMNWRFRDEVWASEFKAKVGDDLLSYPKECYDEIEKIYECIR